MQLPYVLKFAWLFMIKNSTTNPVIRDIKEQEVYIGEIPLMTETGTFVINGTERVVVSSCIVHRVSFLSMIRGRLILLANCYILPGLFLIAVHG